MNRKLTDDRSVEPRGYHTYPTPTRRLRRFDHMQGDTYTRAITPCVATMPDGSQVVIRRNHKKTYLTPVGKSVKIRRRVLKSDITTYVDYAERYGLNPSRVAELFRTRRDNGYQIEHRTVNIETNATFRGGDY